MSKALTIAIAALRDINSNFDHEHHSKGIVQVGECGGPGQCRRCTAAAAIAEVEGSSGIVTQQAISVLDESQFGNVREDHEQPGYRYYKLVFITKRHAADPSILIAVTKEQHKAWSKDRIIAIPCEEQAAP